MKGLGVSTREVTEERKILHTPPVTLSARERGDFQTPLVLAQAVCERLARLGLRPATIVEPTCGRGRFLEAARAQWPEARLLGFELDAEHLRHARACGFEVEAADVFAVDWAARLAACEAPVLVLGNPPWVTSAELSQLGSTNRPQRERVPGLQGLAAMTGRSNFDLAETVLRRLHRALPSGGHVAMLCKTTVARRLLGEVRAEGLWRVDARKHFGAQVEAGLFVFGEGPGSDCDLHASLDAPAHARWGLRAGRPIADLEAWTEARAALAGCYALDWRSGVKHDCAKVFELRREGGALLNGFGERVELEPEHLYPLMKSSDLARGRAPRRLLLLTQGRLGAPTDSLRPCTLAYLRRHAERLKRRASRIYRGQPDFAQFGVGPYTLAPHKVAIAGLYAQPRFRALSPIEGRPVVLDDTCYAVSCASAEAARGLAEELEGGPAAKLLRASIFEDQKRPITRALLDSLNVPAQ